MNDFVKLLSGYFLLFILTACGHSHNHEDMEVLKEANKIHLEAVEIDKNIKSDYETLVSDATALMVKGRELTEEEQSFIQKVDQLKESYGYWTENHVEVPGFDHAHDHGHDHSHNHDHHHHGPGLEVSAADMLLIQKEFKDSIISIQKRILELKK